MIKRCVLTGYIISLKLLGGAYGYVKVGLNPMVLVTSGLAKVVPSLAEFSNDGAEFQVMSCGGEREQSLIFWRKLLSP